MSNAKSGYRCPHLEIPSLRMYLASGVQNTERWRPTRAYRLSYGSYDVAEKNWIPFVYQGKTYFVYTPVPHVIVSAKEEPSTPNIRLPYINHRRKFRSQTSDNMDRWKAEQGRGREKRKIRREKSRKRKSQKKEDADARKGRKVAKHCVFPMICGSGGSKSRLAKAAGAEPAGQMRDEKLHAVVARSTFPSQNAQNTPWSDHFWKLRCRKSARRCGAKHISKSKCTKHTMYGPLLAVELSKKCMRLWREAHIEVKMYKTHHVRTIFGGSDVVSRGRRKGFWTLSKVSKTWGFCSIFNYNYHYTKLHYTTLHYTTLHSTTLHYTTLHYTTTTTTQLHSTTLHYTPLH